MHFRERGNAVQIIRTVYDSGTKKGKSEIVGRLAKTNPQITDDLKDTLSAEERKEVAGWIEGFATVERLRKELTVRTLPEQLALAEEWFKDHKGDDARILAATLSRSWVKLRVALKRNGLVD